MKKKKKFQMPQPLRSFRVLIMVAVIIMGFVPVIMLKSIMIGEYKSGLINDRMTKLKNITIVLENDIDRVDFLANKATKDIESQISQITGLYTGRILIIDSNLKILYDTYRTDAGKICIYKGVTECVLGDDYCRYSDENDEIEICEKIVKDDGSIGVLLMSVSTKDIDSMILDVDSRINIIILIVFVLVLLVAFLFAIYSTKPFKNFEKSIDSIKMGNFDVDIETQGFSELDMIEEAIEHLFQRMKVLDQSRDEFVSNVSHELKTPITSIKILADSLVASENVPEEMYKEFMIDIVAEIDRENEIITDLLSLVRMDKKTEKLKFESVSINELIEVVLKRLRPIAAEKNIELVFESFRPVIAEVDQVKMTMVVSNLVENAVKYNVMDGYVRVSLNADLKYFYIKVVDSGIGIPEEEQSKIFDRFYRVDKARSRETGGTGLGLAITESAIRLHKGEIKLHSKEGEGTTVNIRVPLNHVED